MTRRLIILGAVMALAVLAVGCGENVEGTYNQTSGGQVITMTLKDGVSDMKVGGVYMGSSPYEVKDGHVEFIGKDGYGLGAWEIGENGTLMSGDDKSQWWVKVD